MRRWIKCETRLPEEHEDVLMLFDNGRETNMAVGFLCRVDEHVTFWCAYSDCGWYMGCDESPVYWMPIPPLPKTMMRRTNDD